MNVREVVRKEIRVALTAQSTQFRVYKYIIFGAFLGAIYAWRGAQATWLTLGVLLVIALAVHFFFRWKTEAWTKAWGPYKPK